MKITEDKCRAIVQNLKNKRHKHWSRIDYELQDDSQFLLIRIYLDDQTDANERPAPGKDIALSLCSSELPERSDGPLYSWTVVFLFKGDVIDSAMGGGTNGVI